MSGAASPTVEERLVELERLRWHNAELEQQVTFLHKPFTVRTLLERVRAALGDPCPGGAARRQK